MTIEIANRLVERRKAAGLSQEELAEKLGVSRQAVSKWERGEASPDTDNLIALARLYNISIDELLNGEKPVEEEEAEQEVVDPIPDNDDDDDDDEDEDERKENGFRRTRNFIHSIGFSVAVIVYLVLGFTWTSPSALGWSAGWIVFLIPPMAASVCTALEERKVTRFAFPLFIVSLYCGLGIIGSAYGQNFWHPWWILFLLIPLFYTLFGFMEVKRK